MKGEVTGELVEAAMSAAGIHTVDHHTCAACGYMTKYVRKGGQLFFDAGCYCTDFAREPEPKTWDEAAAWINMQGPEFRDEIAAHFGIRPGDAAEGGRAG